MTKVREATRSTTVSYRRESAFSYACRACSRCCHEKIIQLNPYEVARLARNRGISTTEFLAHYSQRSGTALKRVENGACIFLTSQGCGVHQDRPLVCRLYPLGRKVTAEGVETFHEVTPHPETEGEYGTLGRVEDFLDRQGAGPFVDAVDRYVEVVGRMAAALSRRVERNTRLRQDVQDVVDELAQGVPDWLDMDRIVGQYCAERVLTIPTDVSRKMTLHIYAIEEWLQQE